MLRRKRGPNNVTYDCKTSIMSVYNALGGAEGMLKWAQRHQTEYYNILAKILPKDFDITNRNIAVNISLYEVDAGHQPEVAPEASESVH